VRPARDGAFLLRQSADLLLAMTERSCAWKAYRAAAHGGLLETLAKMLNKICNLQTELICVNVGASLTPSGKKFLRDLVQIYRTRPIPRLQNG